MEQEKWEWTRPRLIWFFASCIAMAYLVLLFMVMLGMNCPDWLRAIMPKMTPTEVIW